MPRAFLLLAVISLGTMGVTHKVADHRGCRPEGVNFVLFLGAGVVMLGVTFWRLGPRILEIAPVAVLTAMTCGFLSSVAILSFQHGVRFGKISTSWLIMNLSTALPTVLSVLIYGEAVSARRALGLFLAVVALFILWLERKREESAGSLAVPSQTAVGER